MARKSRRDDHAEDESALGRDGPAQECAGELDEESGPSRTQRKKASEELQDLGEALIDLRSEGLAHLPLPERLRDAVLDARRITSFGAKRRQLQYIGKLMRQLDAAAIEAVRSALLASKGQSAKEAALLHRAERWREALVADDAELERWLTEHPATDAQQLRALIRQARKDVRQDPPGEPSRQGRAYRQIFTLVRAQLATASREG